MQNRYTGDIGDFAKLGILRAFGTRYRLGVAWYLFPDERHNKDGRHTAYLNDPKRWRRLDPVLFDTLHSIVESHTRSVRAIEGAGLLNDAVFSDELLAFEGGKNVRGERRADWFRAVLTDLCDCDVVFADPDNGLCEDTNYCQHQRLAWKQMPLSEALVLAAGRVGVFYHHNTRWPGGHTREIQHWLQMMGSDALALYWRAYSNRTFFVVNPTSDIDRRLCAFVERWSPYFELHRLHDRRRVDARPSAGHNRCPECAHAFRGTGWDGIDAHWKARHADIMPYARAWPIIKAGGRPSAEPK